MTRSTCPRYFGAIACALLAAPAAASAAWTPAQTIGITDDTGSRPEVAIAVDGSAVAGWTKRDLTAGGGPGAVQFAFRPAAGPFGPAVNVDPAAPDFGAPFPARQATDNALVAIRQGLASVFWVRSNNGDLRTSTTSDGTFAAPADLGTAFTSDFVSDHNVSGDTALVNHDGVLVYKQGAAVVWVTASFGGGAVREATVAVDPSGRALIAWIDNARRVKVRKFNVRTGAFTSPTRIVAVENALVGGFFPNVGAGIDSRGRGVVAWRRTIAGREIVRAAFLRADATIRPPGRRNVSPANRRAGQFDVAMAANGNATIAWTRRDAAIAGTARGPVFFARRSPVALQWTAPALVAAGQPGIAFGPPSVAMARTFTYVTWFGDRTGGPKTIQVSRRVNVGPWTRVVIDPAVDDRGVTAPEVDARGSWAIVGWRSGNGLCCADYKVSVWDPNP